MTKLANCFVVNDGLLDLTNSLNHPIQMRYSEIFAEALLSVRVEDGRVNPKGTLLNHPIVLALSGLKNIKEQDWYEHLYSHLTVFYDNFSPKTISEWFGLEFKHKNALMPPYYSVLPWRARSIEGFGNVITDNIKKEAVDNGLESNLEFGWTYAGPVSKNKIEAEAIRFIEIYKSILKDGYKRCSKADGDIKITALVDKNNDWRWFPTSGIHRCYVLASLGYSDFFARVNLVVFEDEVEYYPHVVDGLYTQFEAIQIFKQIFKG